MSDYDSGTVRLDPISVRQRAFDIRLRSIEKLYTTVVRVNAQPGRDGKAGDVGPRGPKGDTGAVGPMPMHRWEGSKLQFQQGPDGDTWGALVDLRGPQGDQGFSGGGAVVVREATPQFSYMPSGW